MKPTTDEIRKRWAIPHGDDSQCWSFHLVNSVSMLCDRVDELEGIEVELAAYRNAQGNPHRNYVDEFNALLTGKDERIAQLEADVALHVRSIAAQGRLIKALREQAELDDKIIESLEALVAAQVDVEVIEALKQRGKIE